MFHLTEIIIFRYVKHILMAVQLDAATIINISPPQFMIVMDVNVNIRMISIIVVKTIITTLTDM